MKEGNALRHSSTVHWQSSMHIQNMMPVLFHCETRIKTHLVLSYGLVSCHRVQLPKTQPTDFLCCFHVGNSEARLLMAHVLQQGRKCHPELELLRRCNRAMALEAPMAGAEWEEEAERRSEAGFCSSNSLAVVYTTSKLLDVTISF